MGINTNSGQVERNNYIDFLRGIAAINIVAIHTAFWGGPKLYSSMVLEYNFIVGCTILFLFIRLEL